MKICIYGPASNVHTQRWCMGLASIGHKIYLVSQQSIGSDYSVPGISVINPFLLSNKLQHSSKIISRFLGILNAGRIMKELNCDVYHMHWLVASGVSRYIWSNLPPRRIISVWGQDIVVDSQENIFRRNAKILALRQCEFVCATSHYLRAVTKSYCKNGQRIDVIPFGVEVDKFYPSRPKKRDPIIGFIKHLYPKYGPDILIDAMAVVKKQIPEAKLIIVGKGPMESELKKVTKRHGIDDAVHFLGYVDNNKLPAILQSLSIFVMPSIFDSETFGVAAVEAMSCGIPVVSTWVGGIPEVIDDNITGYLVPPRDYQALAEKIIYLLKNVNVRNSMGQLARRKVEQDYDWKKSVTKMNNLYLEALAT